MRPVQSFLRKPLIFRLVRNTADDPLEAGLVEGLRDPAAYPLDPDASSGVEEIQTQLATLRGPRSYSMRP